MTRLLIDGRSLTKEPKGVGRYAYHLCLQLNKLLPPEWKMDIVAYEEDLPEFSNDFRGNFFNIPYFSEFTTGKKLFPKLIKKFNSSILLRPNEGIGHGYGIPQVTVCHDINEWIAKAQESQGRKRSWYRKSIDKIKNYYIGRSLQESEFVLCNSNFIGKSASKHYSFDYKKTVLAYCGIDNRFYEYSKNSNEDEIKKKYQINHYILTFATGDYRENFLRLPEIINNFKKFGLPCTFVIAGVKMHAPYAERLQYMLIKNNLILGLDYIFLGFFGEDKFTDLVELYTAADFYLELSIHEGFGMQLAEAMACGTTCISTDKGALREVGGDQVIYINDPLDSMHIASIIEHSYRNKLHKRCNQLQIEYTKKFSWEKTGLAVHACLKKTAEKYQC